MDNNAEALGIARNLNPYIKKVAGDISSNCMRSKLYTVSVAPNASTGLIGVRDAFDTHTMSIPFAPTVASAVVGDTVWCVWMGGNMSTLVALYFGDMVTDNAVRYDYAQSLTNNQKTIARKNIGVEVSTFYCQAHASATFTIPSTAPTSTFISPTLAASANHGLTVSNGSILVPNDVSNYRLLVEADLYVTTGVTADTLFRLEIRKTSGSTTSTVGRGYHRGRGTYEHYSTGVWLVAATNGDTINFRASASTGSPIGSNESKLTCWCVHSW